jgi:soluble lytic murein transglycosylase-like protein
MAKLSYSQIVTFVSLHNSSTFSDSTIIALIYKESGFDPTVKAGSSTATGLMQVTKTALNEVNRVDKTSFEHSAMKVPASNISVGTRYLRICQKRKSSQSAALDYYGTGPGYSTSILAAAAALDALPKPVTDASALVVLEKKIGKR